MTLTEIQQILNSLNLQEPGLNVERRTNYQGEKVSVVTNLISFKAVLEEAEKLPFLSELKDSLRNSAIYSTTQDSVLISLEEADMIRSSSKSLLLGLFSLRSILNDLLLKETKTAVRIKIPEPKDLKDAIDSLRAVEKSISQCVIHPDVGGTVTLRQWQPGSFWIELVLGTTAAVTVVGLIAQCAVSVIKKTQHLRLTEKQLDAFQIQNEAREEIKRALKSTVDSVVQETAKSAHDTVYKSNDPEQLERLKMAIREFSDLIERGAQFRPALTAASEVQETFPKFSENGLNGPLIQLLSEHASAEKAAQIDTGTLTS